MISVRLDHVSKQFTLQHERPRSFQELFLNMIRLKRSTSQEKYWALRDVSFEVKKGEMVGIIGENGAGKSTLLKLLTRIIEPSAGTITVNGRVSALLELGAGFHPDLTGRENIYLNGSVLGFSKADMDGIFDSILAFSEMERFIDVPVKHYSSGMYMRLGFSIAIHVEPEILLVDEVLAVGDQAFQYRCLDRINRMKRQGVTIILVTHSLKSVREMCDRAIWLDEGRKQADGAVQRVLEQYMAQVLAEDEQALLQTESVRRELKKPTQATKAQGRSTLAARDKSKWRWGSREAEITRVQILDDQGQERRAFKTGDPAVIRIHFVAHQQIKEPQFGLAIYHAGGFHINGPNTTFAGLHIEAIEGEGYIDHAIDSLPLLEGTYLVSASVGDYDGVHPYDYHHQAYTFRVRASETIQEMHGTFLIPATWHPGPTGFASILAPEEGQS